MKKLIAFTLLLILNNTTFCQSTSSSSPVVQTNYLKKSKTERTAAISLLTGGSIAIVAGIVVWGKGFSDGMDWNNPEPDAGAADMKTGDALFITAGLMIVASVPLFIFAAKHKRKAASLSFNNQQLPRGIPVANTAVPSLTLKISL